MDGWRADGHGRIDVAKKNIFSSDAKNNCIMYLCSQYLTLAIKNIKPKIHAKILNLIKIEILKPQKMRISSIFSINHANHYLHKPDILSLLSLNAN